MVMDSDDALEVDRLLRGHVSAMLLGEEEEMIRIFKRLEEMKDAPEYNVYIMETVGALVPFVIQKMANADEEEVAGYWSELSRDIELEFILGEPDG